MKKNKKKCSGLRQILGLQFITANYEKTTFPVTYIPGTWYLIPGTAVRATTGYLKQPSPGFSMYPGQTHSKNKRRGRRYLIPGTAVRATTGYLKQPSPGFPMYPGQTHSKNKRRGRNYLRARMYLFQHNKLASVRYGILRTIY